MADRQLRVILTGDSADLVASMAEADAAVDAASDSMGGSVEEAGKKTEGIFSKLGNAMSNMGLPFSKSMQEIGAKFDETSTKGQKFSQAMRTVGGATLAIGAAAVLGVGIESVVMADKFDTAQAMLKTAVTDSGHSWALYGAQMTAAEKGAANLGFNMTDVAGVLQQLTTATNSPKEALGALTDAEDLARMKGISLSTAGQIMAKVFAGSTRALTAMGINLGIGTGKLTAIKTASEAVTTAQIHLKQTEEEIANGAIKANVAFASLANAHRAVSLATEKLTRDQGTIALILKTVADRTKGAAAAYGQTLSGQMDIARAHLHDLGISFGEWLLPKIDDVISAVTKVVDWFSKNTIAAKILGGVIGGVLSIAVGMFAVNKVGSFVKGIGSMIGAIENVAAKFLVNSGIIVVSEDGITVSSEAMGVATKGALGPIGIALAVVMVAFMLFHHHWKTIWKDIKTVALAAWHFLDNDVIHPIVRFFDGTFGPILRTAEKIWNMVWTGIKQEATDAYNLIWGDVLRPLVHFFEAGWTTDLHAAKAVWDFLWNGAKDTVSTVWNFIHGDVLLPIQRFFASVWSTTFKLAATAWNDFWNGAKAVVSGIWSVISPIINAITGGISQVVGAIGTIAHIGGKIASFFGLAEGGYVTKPTFALVGEAGPEYVIPEKLFRNVKPTDHSGVAALPFTGVSQLNGGQAFAGGAAASSAGGPVTLDIRLVVNGRELANAITPDIRAALLRKGRSTINIGLS